MNSTELIAVFRDEMSDTERPYIWGDVTLQGYIDEAQKLFCRNTFGIEDARSFKLSVSPSREWYALDPSVLKLRAAINRVTGRPVPLVSAEKLVDSGMRFNGDTGAIKALVIGLEKNMLRAWPMPNAAATIDLMVLRLPAELLPDAELEIDDQHHRNLLLWVKHRAFDTQGGETASTRKADDFLARWNAYCDKARAEQSRARRPVGTVSYGGI